MDGQAIGVVKDEEALNDMLEELKAQYVNENTVESEFVENLSIDYVYAADTVLTTEEMRSALEAARPPTPSRRETPSTPSPTPTTCRSAT